MKRLLLYSSAFISLLVLSFNLLYAQGKISVSSFEMDHASIDAISNPRLDPNGEKRTEKVMIYLRPSLYADVKDWANLHGKTITDCIVGMIEVYMQGKQEKLALFRELRDNE